MTTFADVLKEFFPSAVALEDLPPTDDLAKKSARICELYTNVVAAFKLHANPLLSELGRHVWDIHHHRIVPVTLWPAVATIHFGVVVNSQKVQQGLVMVPENWGDMVEAEPVMQLGAILFTASQVVDYYNGRLRFESSNVLKHRAMAYEAEFLKDMVVSKLNAYQRHVLSLFPSGFDTKCSYPYKGVTANFT
jgi:hypothetical protein